MKISTITRNFMVIWKVWFALMGSIFSILSIILLFFTREEVQVKDGWVKLLIFITIVVCSFVIAVLWINCVKQKNVIWSSGSGKILIRYGDILKMAFPRKDKGNKIIVVPVNTCFDTLVDSEIAKYQKPLVSPNTIHGRGIKKMEEGGRNRVELDEAIEGYLKLKDIKSIKKIDSKKKS